MVEMEVRGEGRAEKREEGLRGSIKAVNDETLGERTGRENSASPSSSSEEA